MKKGEKQDRAKAATTAKYDKLRSGKGKQQQHNEAMTGNYAPKRQGTSDGYMPVGSKSPFAIGGRPVKYTKNRVLKEQEKSIHEKHNK